MKTVKLVASALLLAAVQTLAQYRPYFIYRLKKN
jgi:hypothetical protein